MSEKFLVDIKQNRWSEYLTKDRHYDYFDNFWDHCQKVAAKNKWLTITVANYELKSLGGKLIQTKTQGWYLRWDNEVSHTMFVLKWS